MKDLSTRQPVPRSPIQVFSKRNTVIGSLTSSGQIFKPNGSCTVLYVLVQILSATTIQLQENSAPVSAPYLLPANSIIRFAGRFLSGNEVLSLSLSPSASIVYEIVWLKDFDTTFLVAETQVFIPNPSVSFPNTLTANQGAANPGSKWSMEIDSPLDAGSNLWVNPSGGIGSWKSIKSNTGSGSVPPVITVPVGKKWRLKSAYYSLLTSATAGNRQLAGLVKDASGNQFAAAFTPIVQTASINQSYTFGPSVTTSTAAVLGQASVGFPEVLLAANYFISSFISGGLASDQLTIIANVEEFNDA